MKRIIIIFTAIFTCCFVVSAQEPVKKALVIGIDTYSPPKGAKVSNSSGRLEWPDLSGCKNDALAMKDIIITRFGYDAKNINELYDAKATRAAILKGMEDLLNNTPENGIALIYYAGHGSFIRNSLSKEADKYDESMVPADTWKEGVADIRDKELARMFNRFIDKKVKLTAIFDCCHSGSIARGLYPGKSRFIGGSDYDVKDSSTVVAPETRPNSGYLIISAAQDNEPAKEHRLDYKLPAHGAFTLALMEVLKQQSVKASAQNLFNAVRAMIKSFGKTQEPVLAGDPTRFSETLLGIDKGLLSDKIFFPVMDVQGNKIIIQAGFAAGINPENELTGQNDSTVKIRITNVTGMSQSEAELISGKLADVKKASPFEVTNWVSSKAPLLKIYIPESNFTYDEIVKQAAVNAQLRTNAGTKWYNNFERAEPDVTINFAGGKAVANDFTTRKVNIPLKEFTLTEVQKVASNKNLFVNLPAPGKLTTAIKAKFAEFKTLQIVNKPEEAHYILYGTTDNNNKIAYGLVKADISLKDSLGSMPLYTKAFPLLENSDAAFRSISDSLFVSSLKLSKIRGWLTLTAPQEAGFFPYRLVMRNAKTKTEVDSNGIKIGDKVSLTIEAEENYLEDRIEKKYIYVFTIDSKGFMQLVYPTANMGANDNKFPIGDDEGRPQKKLTILNNGTAAEPIGTDNYFLLASKDPIQAPGQIFNQEGVRGTPKGKKNSLSALLEMGNESAARGLPTTTPSNWNLVRLSVKVSH
jgi:hypothetical protein